VYFYVNAEEIAYTMAIGDDLDEVYWAGGAYQAKVSMVAIE
jgi:hypothetical protein